MIILSMVLAGVVLSVPLSVLIYQWCSWMMTRRLVRREAEEERRKRRYMK